MAVWRDCGWRTRLGTCFYDRLAEASRLEKLVERGWSVLVAGPRNSGKSELVRYVLRRRVSGRTIWVDCRRLVSRRVLGEAVEALGVDARGMLERLARMAAERLGLGDFYDAALRLAEALGAPIYLVVDEVHLLAGVEALEAVAKEAMLEHGGRVVLVATSSEGYMLEARVAARLSGYRVELLTVAEMDGESFEGLYEEYCSKVGGCRAKLETIEVLAGRFPGYLGELGDADPETLQSWVHRRAEILDEALLDAAGETGRGYREVLEAAYRLLVEERRVEEPFEHRVALKLVERNVAYPVEPPRLYRPQLGVYRLLLEEMVEGHDAPTAARRVCAKLCRG